MDKRSDHREPSSDTHAAAFEAWLQSGDGRVIRFVVTDDDDRWHVLSMDFNIAGFGSSEEAAWKNLRPVLQGYLYYCFTQGRSFEESFRPIPVREQWAYRLRSAFSSVKLGMRTYLRRVAVTGYFGDGPSGQTA